MNENWGQVGLAVAFVLSLLAATVMAQTPKRNPYPGGDRPSERAQWFMRTRRSRDAISPAAHRYEAVAEARRLPVLRPRLRSPVAGATMGAYGLPGLGSDWTELGPRPETDPFWGNVAGRLTAIAVDLGKDSSGNTVYLGGADGGLWLSTNALGANPTFTPIGDSLPSLSIGSIALDDSTTPTTIYVGTGEANYSGDSYYGDGVFKSTDGGQTWMTGSGVDFLGSAVSSLLVDPTNPQVLIAGIGYSGAATRDATASSPILGIVRSDDGGATWLQVYSAFWVSDVIYDPADQDYYAATLDGQFERSTDRGQTWADLPDPYAPDTYAGRTSLAVRGTTLFALVADSDGKPLSASDCAGCTGLMESGDEGQTWTSLNLPDGLFYNGAGHQGWYDQYIAAPAGTTELIVGGIDVWVGTASSGNTLTWTNLTNSYTTGSVHPDQHAVWCLSPQSWIIANDGGAWSTTDAGTDWANLNATLGTIQFESISTVPGAPGSVFGGSQDNGTALATASSGTTWSEVWGGDGGYTAANPADPSQLFTENYDVSLQRSDDGGANWQPVVTDTTITEGTQFYVPYVLNPADSSNIYLLTSDTVWRGPAVPPSTGAGWAAISADLVASPVYLNALAAAPNAAGVVYVGASDGSLTVSSDADATSTQPVWTQMQPGDNGLGPVSAVAVSPRSAQTVYWGLGYLGASAYLFKSADGGKTAVNIAGDLPGVPINAILIDPYAPENIYVATDVGVFLATDGGTANEQWLSVGDNLPAAAVLSLAFAVDANANPILLAGTHGRGAWSIPAATLDTAEAVVSTSGLVFKPQAIAASGTAQSVTLRNVGGAALTLAGITTSGDFSQTNNCGTSLAVGATCSISVTFTPTAMGLRKGALTVADTAAIPAQTVALSGMGLSINPVATLSTTSLTFASEYIGSSGPTQTVTLTNSGAHALAITNVTTSGDFSQTNTCGSSVAGGATCAITVSFMPTASGSRTGTLTFTDNAADSPQSVSLSGTGTLASAATLSPASLSFAAQVVGQASMAQTVTLTNSGDLTLTIASIAASGDFAETNTCGSSVVASANCTVSITFEPTATGNRTGTLTFTDNAPNSPQVVSLLGKGLSLNPVATLSATSLTFASQAVGTDSTMREVTLTNSGQNDLVITSVTTSGDFSEANACGSSVAGGANCVIFITFKPTATGNRTGALAITDNSAGSPQSVALSGTGTPAPPAASLSPVSLNFSSQEIEQVSAAQAITLTNSGGSALIITGIATAGDFAETNTCGSSVAAAANCTISVTFKPTAGGNRFGTLTFTDNASDSPQAVPLFGPGLQVNPVATFSPTSLTFASQVVGSVSPAHVIVLSNGGASALAITSISASGDFFETNYCGSSVVGGGACIISVTFKPTTTGNRAGSLTVADNAADSPQSISLAGTGKSATPAVTLSPASLTFARQTVGQAGIAQTVTLTNSGGSALAITSITASGDFTQTNTCGSSVAAGA
ncbi:MAG: choice-of-anchor D domain-containing protein, partial [Acidobacteria bacterium]